MIINHNITALNTHRQLSSATNGQANSMEKLSSGLRINKASDDAAGLSISEKMRGQIRGLEQASANAQDGISLMQTAEGALNETHDILQRMRELSVQSANDTNTDTDRKELQKEVNQLSQEITRIGNDTEFNTKGLLDGAFKGTFQIGANSGQNLTVEIGDMRATELQVAGFAAGTAEAVDGFDVANTTGSDVTVKYATAGNDAVAETTAAFDEDTNTIVVTLKQAASTDNGTTAGAITATKGDVMDALNTTGKVVATDNATTSVAGDPPTAATSVVVDASTVYDASKGIDISSQGSADAAITTINNAIESVSSERSKLGSFQNRLDHTINNLGTSAENLTAAESRIRDVDYAEAA